MPAISPAACRPRNRCRQYHACDSCARIRQARIADRADSIFPPGTDTYLTVIKPRPNSGQTIATIRRRFLRNNRPWAFLWTVEQGQITGAMHFNIITTNPAPYIPVGIAFHHSKIRTTPGHVAAYISKRAQRPHPDDYPAPAFGASGPAAKFLLAQRASVPVAALTAEHLLTKTNTVDAAPGDPIASRSIARAALARCRAILDRYHRPAMFEPDLPPTTGASFPPPTTRPSRTHGRARQ